MSRIYSQLFFHIVWSTSKRGDAISEEIKQLLEKTIQAKCREMACILHAIGIAADHIHLLVSVPPNVRLSDFVRDVKGSSSHFVNQAVKLETPLHWQRGYGILSVSGHDEAKVIDYISNQWERHKSGNIWPSLEKTETEPTRLQPDS